MTNTYLCYTIMGQMMKFELSFKSYMTSTFHDIFIFISMTSSVSQVRKRGRWLTAMTPTCQSIHQVRDYKLDLRQLTWVLSIQPKLLGEELSGTEVFWNKISEVVVYLARLS